MEGEVSGRTGQPGGHVDQAVADGRAGGLGVGGAGEGSAGAGEVEGDAGQCQPGGVRLEAARGGVCEGPRTGRHHQADPRLCQAGRRLRIQQGQGPERADRDALHATCRPRPRRHPPTPGRCELGTRGRLVRHRGDPHRPRLRREGRADRAGGLGLLRRRRDRRLPGPGRPLLHNGADERLRQGGRRGDRRERLETDHVPPSGVGQRGGTLDIGRRDRRDRVHRLRLQTEEAAGHRTIDRAPRQTPEPSGPARRTGRAVHRLALPCRVHRHPPATGGRRA